jgi:hypothetical protein
MIEINTIFPGIDRRAQVVFRELLSRVEKEVRAAPLDRELIDLISRARSISASFDSGVKK